MSNVILYNHPTNDELLRSVIRSHLSPQPYSALNEELLREGMTDGLVKDAIQFLVAAGAEYGLGAVTLPAAGAGLAVGPTVETIVDAAFAAEGVASAVSSVQNVSGMMKEYAGLWDEAAAAYGADLKSYYATLVKIVQKALNDLGEKASDTVEELGEKLQGAIQKLISKMVDALKSGIKLIIPDATIGVAAAKAFQTVLDALAENAYDLLAGAISKVKMLEDFVRDPSTAVDFFRDVFDQVVELMMSGAQKLADMSWVDAIVAGGIGGGAVLKKLGPSGLEKAASAIKDQAPKVLDVIDGVLTVLVPTTITAVGLFQILMTGDWKSASPEDTEAPKEEKEKLAASFNVRGDNMLITKANLRKIIKESLLQEQQKMQDIIVNPYEEVGDYNILANFALTGDIAGALAHPDIKPYVDKNEMGWVADEAGGWFENVGEEGYDMPAPEGWDRKKAYKFLRDLEDADWKVYDKQAKAAIKGDPDKEFLEFLGNEFISMIEPNDLPDIKWKEYKKYIRVKPPRSISHGVGEINIPKENIKALYPGAYEDFTDFLTTRTGGQLGRRAPYKKSPPPYYD